MGLFSRSKNTPAAQSGRIKQIRRRIDALKLQDLRTETIQLGDREVVGYICGVHGAEKHRYEYADPAGADVVASFEVQVGMSLPSEYRDWVTQVGNGGVGPMYGLFPVGEAPVGTQLIRFAIDFPLSVGHTLEAVTEGDDKVWGSQIEQLHRGIIYLADEGCAAYNILILRGPAAGQVWWLNVEYAVAEPILHPTTGAPLSFLDWYELWLERATDSYQEQIESFADFIKHQ